jgi:HEPN domain-containing protein
MSPEAELIREWLSKAGDDLRLAELAISAAPPVPWAAAFHAQQAVEKVIKAFLTHHQIEFERTHNLDYLLDLCVGADPQTEQLRNAATILTDFAVEARYPLPGRDPTPAEAQEALALAREASGLLRSLLPSESGGADVAP